MSSRDKLKHTLPYRLDTEAYALGYYVVLDFNYKPVREFETIESAYEFIAKVNRSTIDAVKSNARNQAQALQEYRKNLKHGLSRKALKKDNQEQIASALQSPTLVKTPKTTTDSNSGWSWEGLPDVIKQRFPPPPQRQNFSSVKEYEEASAYWKGRVGKNIGLVLQQYKHSHPPKKSISPVAKTLLIWVSCFLLIVLSAYLLVYLLIYLDDIGIKDSVINVTGAVLAWLTILVFLFMYYSNRTGEKLPLFSPESTLFDKIFFLVIFLIIVSPVLVIAITSLRWIFN